MQTSRRLDNIVAHCSMLAMYSYAKVAELLKSITSISNTVQVCEANPWLLQIVHSLHNLRIRTYRCTQQGVCNYIHALLESDTVNSQNIIISLIQLTYFTLIDSSKAVLPCIGSSNVKSVKEAHAYLASSYRRFDNLKTCARDSHCTRYFERTSATIGVDIIMNRVICNRVIPCNFCKLLLLLITQSIPT